MYCLGSIATLCLVVVGQAYGSTHHHVPLRQRSATTIPSPAPTSAGPKIATRSALQKDSFDFDVHSDQIVPMMDALADLSARIADTWDPNFHKKDDDDGPPFKCHCKCSLLGGCECWCGDKDKAGGRGGGD